MPMYLVEEDLGAELEGVESALIVPCRFCPAASAAVRAQEPYIEPFRRALETDSYARQLGNLRQSLEAQGIRVEVFMSRLPHHFVLCMWTARRRRQLAERAKQHDAVVVVGCEAATETVRSCVDTGSSRVIAGMKSEGLMSIQPRFRLPATVLLELEGVTTVEVGGRR